MNKQQTLDAFWNGFGIEAYDENTVPDDAQMPYITYESVTDSMGNTCMVSASLWYRSHSWAGITQKEQEIADFITRGGRMLAYDGGAMWIQRDTPWAQRMSDPNSDSIRRIVLSLLVEYLD